MEFINVFENSYELYKICVKNGWTDSDYESWFENGGELEFFEGDPDVIKIDGHEGFFAKIDDKVFFYFDCFYGDAEELLNGFFSAFKTGITIGGSSWVDGIIPNGVKEISSWRVWNKEVDTGIAFRGGAGYSYWLTDWSKWLENKECVTA